MKSTRPNIPNMIEGIPASVSVVNSIIFTSFHGLAYSFRYMAEPTPIGVAMTIVTTTM